MRMKEAPVPVDAAFPSQSGTKTYAQWHRVLGHTPVDVIKQMASKNLVKGLVIDLSDQSVPHCAVCYADKQTAESFPHESLTVYTAPGHLVVSDVWGPSPEESIFGEHFLLTFTDVYSRYSFVYFLKTKGQVADVFEEFAEFMENVANARLKRFRADNEGEFTSNRMRAFCRKKGIKLELTAPYSPSQNGIAERLNRTPAGEGPCNDARAQSPSHAVGRGRHTL